MALTADSVALRGCGWKPGLCQRPGGEAEGGVCVRRMEVLDAKQSNISCVCLWPAYLLEKPNVLDVLVTAGANGH